MAVGACGDGQCLPDGCTCGLVGSAWQAITRHLVVPHTRCKLQEPRYRSLAALGVAAVGNAADCAFTPADVARMGLIAGGLPAANGAVATTIAAASSDPASAQAPGGGLQTADTLPSPSAQHGVAAGVGAGVGDDVIMTDMPAGLADGGHTYFGADAMMGWVVRSSAGSCRGGLVTRVGARVSIDSRVCRCQQGRQAARGGGWGLVWGRSGVGRLFWEV